MRAIRSRLDALEAATPGDLPILMVGWGIPDDGLYHGAGNATYTPDELARMDDTHKVIILAYGPHPHDDGKTWRKHDINMTWGDDVTPDSIIPPAAISR